MSEDLRTIPPRSTAALLPTELSDCIASSICLSSTLKLPTSTLNVDPFTTRLPSIVASPPTCKVAVGVLLKIPT